jgi:predicted HTH domain antitoxin
MLSSDTQMKPLVLNLPDDLPHSVALTPQELESQVRLMAALKMFELGKLSSGKAAELAGLSKADFLEACGRYRVSVFNYPDDSAAAELERETAAFRQTRGGHRP